MHAQTPVELLSRSPEETERIGAVLGSYARSGDVFLLVGELGAGKTCLVQGIATGLGVAEHTRSPTFVFVSRYSGRLALYHVDLYRLESDAELEGLGLDEYLYSDGVCAVEWADKALPSLPQEHLLITLEHKTESTRRLLLRPRGRRYEEMVRQMAAALAGASGAAN